MWNHLNYLTASYITCMQNYYPDFNYNFLIIKKKSDTENFEKTWLWTHYYYCVILEIVIVWISLRKIKHQRKQMRIKLNLVPLWFFTYTVAIQICQKYCNHRRTIVIIILKFEFWLKRFYRKQKKKALNI